MTPSPSPDGNSLIHYHLADDPVARTLHAPASSLLVKRKLGVEAAADDGKALARGHGRSPQIFRAIHLGQWNSFTSSVVRSFE